MRGFTIVAYICCTIFSSHFPGTHSLDPRAYFHLITNGVVRNFKSDCVFIVANHLDDISRAVEALKYFAGGQAISCLSREETTLFADRLQKVHTSCNRPAYVHFSVGKPFKQSFLQSYKWSRHSGPTWLVFHNDSLESLEERLTDVDIPFDCEMLVVPGPDEQEVVDDERRLRITEVYRIANHTPLITNTFGSWSKRTDLVAPRESIYSRRNNLQGLVIKTANAQDPPLSSVRCFNGSLRLEGFCGAIWTILEQRMNFTTVHSIVSADAGNSWDAMIGMLLRKEAIMTSTYVTVTPSRYDDVDFSIPIATIPLRIFIRQPARGSRVDWWTIISPFSASLWVAFLVSAALSATALASLALWARKSGIAEDQFSFYDALFLVLGAVFCLQGHPQSAKSLSCRIVCVVVYITGVIALASYSGIITSNLTVNKVEMPFTSLKELANSENYDFGVINNSLSHNQFKISARHLNIGALKWAHKRKKNIQNKPESMNTRSHSPSYKKQILRAPLQSQDAVIHKLFVKHLESNVTNLLGSYLEGFRRVCDHEFALLALAEALSALSEQLDCTPVQLKNNYFKFTASLAFPKHSPYREVFNYNLLKLINGGILSDLHKAALKKKLPSLVKEVPSINLNAVAPILSLLAGGISLAIVFLILEKLLLFVKSL